MEEKLLSEVMSLLAESDALIEQGKTVEAREKIAVIKDKLRPIGSGTNGPEPRQ